jgi:hypothetical protein
MALAVLDPIGSVTQSLVAAFVKGIFKIGLSLRWRLRSAGPTSAEGQICKLNGSVRPNARGAAGRDSFRP